MKVGDVIQDLVCPSCKKVVSAVTTGVTLDRKRTLILVCDRCGEPGHMGRFRKSPVRLVRGGALRLKKAPR